jgi:hypothetical protein
MTTPVAAPVSGCLAWFATVYSLLLTTNGLGHQAVLVEAPFDMPAIQIPVFPTRDCAITEHGAVEGGEGDVAEAIRNAISACHEAGGGRVVIPRGKWLTGRHCQQGSRSAEPLRERGECPVKGCAHSGVEGRTGNRELMAH